MLALKIPINNIIDKVREHFSDREGRDNLDDLKYYHLIDRKKIHSLKTRLVDPSIIQDSNDALAINFFKGGSSTSRVIQPSPPIQTTRH